MEKNIGRKDRKLRIGVGLVLNMLGVLGYAGVIRLNFFSPQAITSIIVAVIGLVLIITAVFRVCPCYDVFGIDTNRG